MAAAIGIDIGGTRLRAARVSGGVIEARAVADSSRDPSVVMARLLDLVAQVRDDTVRALGIGVPGQVQAATRRVLSGGYVDLSGFDFAAEVESATGMGGAVLEQGQVLRGRGSAGQLGHLCVDPNGRACVCGRIGCVESVSSGTAFC